MFFLFKFLKDSNRAEHLKLIKNREREILMANINNLPDKTEDGTNEANQMIDDDRNELLNAAQLAFSSPNPNFVVLDRELLENLNEDDSTQANNEVKQSQQQQQEKQDENLPSEDKNSESEA